MGDDEDGDDEVKSDDRATWLEMRIINTMKVKADKLGKMKMEESCRSAPATDHPAVRSRFDRKARQHRAAYAYHVSVHTFHSALVQECYVRLRGRRGLQEAVHLFRRERRSYGKSEGPSELQEKHQGVRGRHASSFVELIAATCGPPCAR